MIKPECRKFQKISSEEGKPNQAWHLKYNEAVDSSVLSCSDFEGRHRWSPLLFYVVISMCLIFFLTSVCLAVSTQRCVSVWFQVLWNTLQLAALLDHTCAQQYFLQLCHQNVNSLTVSVLILWCSLFMILVAMVLKLNNVTYLNAVHFVRYIAKFWMDKKLAWWRCYMKKKKRRRWPKL